MVAPEEPFNAWIQVVADISAHAGYGPVGFLEALGYGATP